MSASVTLANPLPDVKRRVVSGQRKPCGENAIQRIESGADDPWSGNNGTPAKLNVCDDDTFKNEGANTND
jgi:hypothetical protein